MGWGCILLALEGGVGGVVVRLGMAAGVSRVGLVLSASRPGEAAGKGVHLAVGAQGARMVPSGHASRHRCL